MWGGIAVGVVGAVGVMAAVVKVSGEDLLVHI